MGSQNKDLRERGQCMELESNRATLSEIQICLKTVSKD